MNERLGQRPIDILGSPSVEYAKQQRFRINSIPATSALDINLQADGFPADAFRKALSSTKFTPDYSAHYMALIYAIDRGDQSFSMNAFSVGKLMNYLDLGRSYAALDVAHYLSAAREVRELYRELDVACLGMTLASQYDPLDPINTVSAKENVATGTVYRDAFVSYMSSLVNNANAADPSDRVLSERALLLVNNRVRENIEIVNQLGVLPTIPETFALKAQK